MNIFSRNFPFFDTNKRIIRNLLLIAFYVYYADIGYLIIC